jgi:alpha-1,2-mannosyltransferase
MYMNVLFSGGKLRSMAGLAIVCFYFIVVLMINVFPFLGGQQGLLDFGSFYASGLQIRNGQNPYSPDAEYVWKFNFPRVGAGGKMINLNPPITAMIFGYISRFDPDEALKIWRAVSATLYTGLIFVLAAVNKRNITPVIFIWSFTLVGFWQTLTLGQIYVFLLLFIVLGWVFLQRRKYTLAGMAIGLVIAIKPNFIIWPIFLVVAGYSVTFLTSVLSSLLISSIPLLFHGIQIYKQWLEASSLHIETLILPGNSSILGLTARFHQITAGILISMILVCTLLYFSKQKTSGSMEYSEQVSALGIIAAILASPISWVGYTIFLLPIFFSLNKWTYPVILSAAILSIPFGFILKLWQTSFFNLVIFGWFYGWGILFLLGVVVKNTMMTSSIQTN